MLLVLLSSCTNQIPEDILFRVDVLYEHTILMEELSTNDVLYRINLDMDKINYFKGITTQDKINQMSQAYNIEVSGGYNQQIELLEKRMEEMMIMWSDLQEYS